ncbi:alpha/beta fold hydrolase [Sphingorhabdus sp. 109]|jgi:pimeloyl-ACP methyl ester carboxylesterase|uniref:alpha/beta fold hydrolase n=1 Tax=Sphingorhabdus sp. 109 TaxID=2653173 RepID=UPI0012F1E353|nr:alpha/beta hydrolase [Sphingorhabdus sp. 109]VWX60318.1 conserved exported hypothetical protein [Sphingorhabdus sp. 109]
MTGPKLKTANNSCSRSLPHALRLLAFAMMILVSSATYASPKPEPGSISLADLRAKYETSASRYLDVDGVPLHYADEGQGEPVVLLHASFLNFRAWDGVAAELVRNNYRVIRPDFPSLGLSGIDGKSLNGGRVDFFNRNAEVVAKLLEKLQLDKVNVVATSSGAIAGSRYASYFPDRVSRLVLINSAGLPRTVQSDPNRDRPEERKWSKMKIKPPEFWANLLSRNFFAPDMPPEWLVTLAYDVNRRAENADPGAYNFKTGDPRPIFAAITAPTLILWGQSNPTVMHLEADVIEHWMTGAPTTIRKYEGLGHYPYIENEDVVMSDILAFLDGKLDDELRQTQRVKVAP